MPGPCAALCLALTAATALCAYAQPRVVAASQVTSTLPEPVRPQYSNFVGGDPVAMVYLHLAYPHPEQGPAPEPVSVTDITWNGTGIAAHLAAPAYDLIWWRALPARLAPGRETQVTLCLRRGFAEPTDLSVTFSDGTVAPCTVTPREPDFRLGTLAFDEGLRQAYLYVESTGPQSEVPKTVWLEGRELREPELRWLSGGYAGGVRVAVITPPEPFLRGQAYTLRVASPSTTAGTAMRAFTGLATFGTYGFGYLERFASAGLDRYNSFGTLGLADFNTSQALGLHTAITLGMETAPPTETRGHPALFGYLISDEPDCQDYSADPSRPMDLRLGTLAQRVANSVALCAETDPASPVMVSVDLTFTPKNYHVYAQIPDLVTPDCYPITLGWQTDAIREKAATAKRAAGPRPFTFVYQSNWEEVCLPQAQWLGPAQIRELGREKLVDPEAVRGFGRAPVAAEVRMQMLYAIGWGSRGLTAFSDSTEAGGNLLFHGSGDLPEIWSAATSLCRALRVVAPLIELSHPVDWATTNHPKLWLKTLFCGASAALVAAVNENCTSAREGFSMTPAGSTDLAFADLPWLPARAAFRVEDGSLTPLESRRGAGGLSWTDPALDDCALYLMVADPALAQSLAERARTQRPVATPEGKQLAPESDLGGVRSRYTP